MSAQMSPITAAVRLLLAAVPPNTELLFYRDDDEPARLEVHWPDGASEVHSLPDAIQQNTIGALANSLAQHTEALHTLHMMLINEQIAHMRKRTADLSASLSAGLHAVAELSEARP